MVKKNISKTSKHKEHLSVSSKPNLLSNPKTPFWINVENNKWWWIGGMIILAFVLRINGAGRFSFWFDEFLHVIPAAEFIDGKGLNHIDGFNGLFTTWVEIIFLGIFGVNEWAGRLPMILFSVATLIPLFFLSKKLFDTRIALTVVFLFSISLYAIFWGRTVRNYATFLPFFLWLHYLLLAVFENNISSKNDFKIISGISINIKVAALILISLILSLLNHQLTVFIFFGWTFYGACMWFANLLTGGKKWLNRYIVFVPLFLSFGLLFTTFGNTLAKKILSLVLPPNIVSTVIPDLTRVMMLWKEKTFESFNIYFGVLETDGNYLYLLGLLGLIVAFIKHRRSALFLVGHFVFLIILFSFVFREPAVSRYLYFILPFYFMAAAYGIWWLVDFISDKVIKNKDFPQKAVAFLLVLTACTFLSNPSQTKAFLSRTEHGQLVDRKISEWYYTNWKDPIKYVKENMQAGDVVLATVPNAPRLYMGIDSAKLGWFRQMRYDGVKKEYVQNEGMGKPVSGYTTDEFISTLQNNPRGWLLADYYFENVMTDPKARQIAIEKLDFHFGASPDGSVKVFSWDNSKPKTEESPLLIELGKPLGTFQSPDLDFNFTIQPGAQSVRFIFDVEGLDSDNEAAIQINNAGTFFIPKPEKSRGWGKEYAVLEVPISALLNGPNKAKFMYNPEAASIDYRPGFVIYNVRMQ